jgi:hypothetical protein
MDLDPQVAASRKLGGPPGFFLASDEREAAFFAARRGAGTVIEIRLSATATQVLMANGAVRQPIPRGISARFQGEELIVPPSAFLVFNNLRAAGEIHLIPTGKP